jgi:hypothetical protein
MRIFLKIQTFALAALIGVAVPEIVHAKLPNPPLLLPREMGPQGSPQAFASLLSYATCVMKHERKATLRFLAEDFPSAKSREIAQQLASDTRFCLKDTALLKLNPGYLRGALIEAAYQQDFGGGAAAVPVRIGSAANVEKEFAPALAECLVQRRGAAVAELLSTRIASTQQAQAFAKLEPDLSNCARQAKVAKYFPELLRFQVAEVLYRQRSNRALSTGAAG